MSSYNRITKHPETGNFELAEWVDDYYGHYYYGVRFADGRVFKAADYKWEFNDERQNAEELLNEMVRLNQEMGLYCSHPWGYSLDFETRKFKCVDCGEVEK